MFDGEPMRSLYKSWNLKLKAKPKKNTTTKMEMNVRDSYGTLFERVRNQLNEGKENFLKNVYVSAAENPPE